MIESTYPKASTVDIEKLRSELAAHSIENINHGNNTVYIYTASELLPTAQADIQSIIDSHESESLTEYQARCVKVIDTAVTIYIIDGGFQYDGKTFSSSTEAQIKWVGLNSIRADIDYPYAVPTKDDSEIYVLDGAKQVGELYMAITESVGYKLGEANVYKQNIAAAPDKATAKGITEAYLVVCGCQNTYDLEFH